ncbi:hypothetical protein E5S69_01785 [Cupriavidus necator]|nr:hypothetical protein [Cupriavidus necator]
MDEAVTSQSNNIHLPNDDERRKSFHWLKRISSYTAWKRILGYYQGLDARYRKLQTTAAN